MEIKKEINNNGYDYVDLGLPSGTLWATCNIGASKPSDYGLYFQWGDTKGYTKGQVGRCDGKKNFALDWSDYKFGAYPNYSKYTTAGAILELEDDAANANMGGDWHIPTPEQLYEFYNNTTTTRTTLDGVEGMKFSSKKDSSKSIFIPAAGSAWAGDTHISGVYGYVFSNMLSNREVRSGQYFCFTPKDAGIYSGDGRCIGLPVRGVIG